MPNSLKTVLSVADPVHGSIGLTEVERALVDTPVFQRLRGVHQTAFVTHVFPSGNFTRFAHSLGVCHVAGRFLESCRARGANLSDQEIQHARVAALLHDIGHYPFSHATEEAAREWKRRRDSIARVVRPNGDPVSPENAVLDHEDLTEFIVRNDRDVIAVLNQYGMCENDVLAYIRPMPREAEAPLAAANLISSDVDADRLDFLLRSAHTTGLPFGRVDLDYLVAEARLDGQRRVAFRPGALRAVEHALFGRLLDYERVVLNKSAVGFERLLVSLLVEVGIRHRKKLPLSEELVKAAVKEGTWHEQTDAKWLEVLRDNCDDGDASSAMCNALFGRRSPRCVLNLERYEPARQTTLASSSAAAKWREVADTMRERIASYSSNGFDHRLVWVFDDLKPRFRKRYDDEEDEAKSARILLDGEESVPWTYHPSSVLEGLAGGAVLRLRLYALLDEHQCDALLQYMHAEVPGLSCLQRECQPRGSD